MTTISLFFLITVTFEASSIIVPPKGFHASNAYNAAPYEREAQICFSCDMMGA